MEFNKELGWIWIWRSYTNIP